MKNGIMYIFNSLPVRDVKLDCEGDGVRIISHIIPATAPAGEEVRMSKEAALRGDGDRLDALKG